MNWTPTSITWMLDGHAYAHVVPARVAIGCNWIFNRPFHMLLNLAVGGDWAGAPSASTRVPSRLVVDWVRVYQ